MSDQDELLRAVVDATWGHAFENDSVPSHEVATKIIEEARIKVGAASDCCHDMVPKWDHRACTHCGGVWTDRGTSWGCAGGKWFSSIMDAKFYQEHGRLPEPV